MTSWPLKEKTQQLQGRERAARHQPGDLFVCVRERAFWSLSPRAELTEKTDDFETNPFFPLVRCYVVGFYR
jgi:hypothetical protein